MKHYKFLMNVLELTFSTYRFRKRKVKLKVNKVRPCPNKELV